MHKCHNYHAILHKLYTSFGKNELRLYLNGAKISSIGGAAAPAAPPLNTPMCSGDPQCFLKTLVCRVVAGVHVDLIWFMAY